jgi:molybdopterin-binding protein
MTTPRQPTGAAAHSPAVYRVPEAAELLGVSADTVRRWADSGRLASSRDSAGRRVIEGAVLAAFAAQPGRAQTLEVGPTGGHSARNRFVGIVTKVTKDTVMAQVEMQAGPFRVVSLMSREAADDLGLAPGVAAVASVKATNVTVELPASPQVL